MGGKDHILTPPDYLNGITTVNRIRHEKMDSFYHDNNLYPTRY